MKSIKGNKGSSKISQRLGAVRGHGPGGVLPHGGSASPGFPAAAQSSPTSGVVKKAGQVSFRDSSARKSRVVRVPVAIPRCVIPGLLVVPAVMDEIELQRRLAIVQATAVLKASGVSQNKAADGFGIPRSLLSVWVAAFAAGGEDALRPMAWNAGRRPTKGRPKRHTAFIELKVR